MTAGCLRTAFITSSRANQRCLALVHEVWELSVSLFVSCAAKHCCVHGPQTSLYHGALSKDAIDSVVESIGVPG
jgi:hypothetical protein